MTFEKFVAYTVVASASVLGSVSLLLFGLFLLGVSFTQVDVADGLAGILAWDALLCLLFFVQHSGMIRKAFRRRLGTWLPDHYQGALYTVASAAALFVLVLCWQNSMLMLISLQGIVRWLMQGVFFLSLLGMIWGMLALHGFDVFGNRGILAHINDSAVAPMSFTIRGPYFWVRHPLYFFTLVLIWSNPDMALDRLLFNILFTVWIIVGTHLEERDLVAELGEPYKVYQRNVPMLVPYKLISPRSIQ